MHVHARCERRSHLSRAPAMRARFEPETVARPAAVARPLRGLRTARPEHGKTLPGGPSPVVLRAAGPRGPGRQGVRTEATSTSRVAGGHGVPRLWRAGFGWRPRCATRASPSSLLSEPPARHATRTSIRTPSRSSVRQVRSFWRSAVSVAREQRRRSARRLGPAPPLARVAPPHGRQVLTSGTGPVRTVVRVSSGPRRRRVSYVPGERARIASGARALSECGALAPARAAVRHAATPAPDRAVIIVAPRYALPRVPVNRAPHDPTAFTPARFALPSAPRGTRGTSWPPRQRVLVRDRPGDRGPRSAVTSR